MIFYETRRVKFFSFQKKVDELSLDLNASREKAEEADAIAEESVRRIAALQKQLGESKKELENLRTQKNVQKNFEEETSVLEKKVESLEQQLSVKETKLQVKSVLLSLCSIEAMPFFV